MKQQIRSLRSFRPAIPLGSSRCLPIQVAGLFLSELAQESARRDLVPALAIANFGCYKGQRMKLPADTVIAAEKVTRYLLVHQTRGDKSAFLARGGYTLETADRFLHDLRTQLLPLDATPLHSTEFGQFYEIRGLLIGPNGVTLQIRSIWMKENSSGVTKFITLIPQT